MDGSQTDEPVSGGLTRFLRDARARVLPEHRDLPEHRAGRRRRVPGLRREEVAELAGISDVWYARFESGRAVLSLSALNRVSDALRLSADERTQMLFMARPDLGDVTDAVLSDSLNGVGVALSELHLFSRAALAASSIEEMMHAATRTAHLTMGKKSKSYLQEFERATEAIPFLTAFGKGGNELERYSQPCSTIPHAMPTLLDGHAFGESDLRTSPSSELRGRTDMGFYAYYSQPIMDTTGLRYIVTAAFREIYALSALERHTLRLIAAICELTLRSSIERAPRG